MGIQADIAGLAELKRLAEAAESVKPGRWYVHRDGLGPEFDPHPRQNFGVDDGQGCVVVWHGVERLGGIPYEEVAEYIAAANPSAVRALIAEVEALRKDAKRYRWMRERAEGSDLNDRIDAAMGEVEK